MSTHNPQYTRKKRGRPVGTIVNQRRLHERRQTALLLRQAGASYAEIVRADIGYNSTSHVAQDMKKILAEFTYETPEDVLVLDLARIDEIQKILTAALRSGDLGQAGPIMRCMQFRRETLGITPEVISDRRQNAQQIQNNGIMVIQGQSTGDYIAAMAQASGANSEEVRRELETVSASNRGVVDAEIVEPKRIRLKRRKRPTEAESDGTEVNDTLDRIEQSAQRRNRLEQSRENIPAVGLSEPLLEVDVPMERTLEVPIKAYDQNINLSSGTPYKKPPRKMSPEESDRVVLRRLRKPPRGGSGNSSEDGTGSSSGSSTGVVQGPVREGIRGGSRMDIVPLETLETPI